MKRAFIIMAAAAALFATSCKKDEVKLGEGEFLATIDNGATPQGASDSKTTIDAERYVIWEAGDQIAINGSVYTTSTEGSSVVFGGGSATGSVFHAFYPATIAGTGAAGTLPAAQTIEAGRVSNLPMYATCGSDRQLTFNNICAVLKIAVPAFVNGATSIVVSSDQRMNGAFTISNNAAVMDAATPTAAEKKVTIAKSTGTFATCDTVYIAVPAQSYTHFKVEFFNGTTSMWNKTLANATLAVNTIYPISMTEMPPVHQYVDLGLSVKWATCNVGAANPWDYGDYFAWGETEPYYSSLSPLTWKSGKTAGYDFASYPYIDEDSWEEVGTQPYDATTLRLYPTNDAARANWGGSWRMPTQSELYELVNNCTWTWTIQNGVEGYSVSRNGYTGSIFLPAAGYFNGTSRYSAGTNGSYWSAARYSGYAGNAHRLGFGSGYQGVGNDNRCSGFTVRPVCE